MPRGTEFTLRAKMPAATPAIRPLTVEPMMMPAIWLRTAGVNQAVAPSIAPRRAPRSSPSRILFIDVLLHGTTRFAGSTSLYNGSRESFSRIGECSAWLTRHRPFAAQGKPFVAQGKQECPSRFRVNLCYLALQENEQ